MNKILTKGRIAWLIILAVLVIDQIIKIWVKTHMYWHESIRVTDWCYIFFTENVGMAFGMEIFGKLFLTLFRLVAVTFIAWFLYKCVKLKLKTGFIVCISLILTGALGNIPSSTPIGRSGCLLSEEIISSFSARSSILPMQPSVAGLSPCFCSIASRSMKLSIRY